MTGGGGADLGAASTSTPVTACLGHTFCNPFCGIAERRAAENNRRWRATHATLSAAPRPPARPKQRRIPCQTTPDPVPNNAGSGGEQSLVRCRATHAERPPEPTSGRRPGPAPAPSGRGGSLTRQGQVRRAPYRCRFAATTAGAL
ncbi:hypothetical protein GCM10009647_038520 [Streptomyces sanglieri]